MRAESNLKPKASAVERCGDVADVILCQNIVQKEREDGTVYEYDEYRIAVPFRDNLLNVVKANRAAWLAEAMNAETAGRPPTIREELIALKEENSALRTKNAELESMVHSMLKDMNTEE